MLGDQRDRSRRRAVGIDDIGLLRDQAQQRRPEVAGATLVVLVADEGHALGLELLHLSLDRLRVVLPQLVVGPEEGDALAAELLGDGHRVRLVELVGRRHDAERGRVVRIRDLPAGGGEGEVEEPGLPDDRQDRRVHAGADDDAVLDVVVIDGAVDRGHRLVRRVHGIVGHDLQLVFLPRHGEDADVLGGQLETALHTEAERRRRPRDGDDGADLERLLRVDSSRQADHGERNQHDEGKHRTSHAESPLWMHAFSTSRKYSISASPTAVDRHPSPVGASRMPWSMSSR